MLEVCFLLIGSIFLTYSIFYYQDTPVIYLNLYFFPIILSIILIFISTYKLFIIKHKSPNLDYIQIFYILICFLSFILGVYLLNVFLGILLLTITYFYVSRYL
jgi:hypothetical protein